MLFIVKNYSPEPTGIGKYNGEMVNWLSRNGFSCTVITTFPYYPFWKVMDSYKRKSFWFKKEVINLGDDSLPINIIRVPHYVPKWPTARKRTFSDLSFTISTSFLIFLLFFKRKYNYVFSVAPPFQITLLAILYKQIKGAKLLYHIQDLEIDLLESLDLIQSKQLLETLLRAENFIFRNADVVSTVSSRLRTKIFRRYSDSVLWFPNWVDTINFFPIKNRGELKVKFGFKSSDFIVLYTASNEKQEVELISSLAKELNHIERGKFVVYGRSPLGQEIFFTREAIVLDNVVYYPFQPVERFNELLNVADIHLILNKSYTSDILLTYLIGHILVVGGISIIAAYPETSLYSTITEYNIAVLVEPQNETLLVKTIKEMMTNDYGQISINARNYALTKLEANKLLRTYFDRALYNANKKNKHVMKSDNRWYGSIENKQKLTKDDAKFLFEQAEKFLKDTVDTSHIIANRTTTLITLVAAILVADISYISSRLNEHKFDFTTSVGCIIAVYLYVLIFYSFENTKPKTYLIPGSLPKDLFVDEFFVEGIEDDKRIIHFYVNETENCQFKIEKNAELNKIRWKRYENILKAVLLLPLILIACIIYQIIRTS